MIPVSGAQGMGEFARARSIGKAIAARWPAAEVRFLVSREAPYRGDAGFPVLELPASPTLCSREVIAEIRRFEPDLVYFDNAGRTDQLRAAHAAGARIIYVSSRPRQRYKAFRLRWMRLIDEHWISYSPLLAGAPGPLERLKLRLAGRPALRFIDAIVSPADPLAAQRECPELPEDIDVLVIPGGGSQFPDGVSSPRDFEQWAAALAVRGFRVALVAAKAEGGSAPNPYRTGRLSGEALSALISRARVVLVNGGDTLVQALALRRCCVAMPMALDQPARIARLAATGAVKAPRPEEVVQVANELLTDPQAFLALQDSVAALAFQDGTPRVLEAIDRLLARD